MDNVGNEEKKTKMVILSSSSVKEKMELVERRGKRGKLTFWARH